MSAFVVSNEHINYILNYGRKDDVRVFHNDHTYDMTKPETLDVLAEVMLAENINAVNTRYNQKETTGGIKFKFSMVGLNAVQAIKACHCFQYQLAEFEGYENTLAYQVAEAVASSATRNIDGYDQAQWDINEPLKKVIA